ncbi:MAG: ABC transporter ATP-binding protein [Firmicutes bacterium]|nr:ABC transporter ATP-binding protein [Bacillota bacterium]
MKLVMQKYKPYIPMVLLVVLFLLGQAMSELLLPSFMADIVNEGIGKHNQGLIYKTGALMVLVSFAAVVCAIIGNMFASRVAAYSSRDIRKALFRRVMTYSANEFEQFSTASLITRSTNDVQNIQQTTVMLLRMAVFAPIMGIGALVNAIALSPSMTWTIGLALIVVLILMVGIFFAVMPKFTILQDKLDRLNLIINERLSGLLVVRAFSSEGHEEERFDGANTELTGLNIFINRTMAFLFPSITLIMNTTCVLIIWAGSKRVAAGDMLVGEVMAFMQYAIHVVMSFLFITTIFIIIPRAAVSARRIGAVLAMEPSIKDAEVTANTEGKGLVEFEDVEFAYPGSSNAALRGISFAAEPGKTTAIIGGTGSGKSSVVNLIPRFYDVSGGRIKVDGADIRDIPLEELRGMIGYVPQKTTLFTGTIKDNILFGHREATDEEMVKAAQIAQADEFINKLEDGYDTQVAQGGKSVSGGQKQRIAIARAVVRRAPIYIFDDSFSALDFSTDARLRKELSENLGGSTIIIVAQRLNTIADADTIIVLDEGRIVGQGTHEELLRSCDVYKEIAASQLSEEELAGALAPEAVASSGREVADHE